MRAALLLLLSEAALLAGLACSPWPWVAPVVGGAQGVALALSMETGERAGREIKR